MDPSIPPPASVEPSQNRLQDPAAATVRTRQVEIIITYHSSDPYCKSCTKLQDDTLERIIALHKRPCDILDFLGTYERPTPKRTTLTRYPQTRMERIAAHWGWFAEVTAPNPFLEVASLSLSATHPEAKRMSIFTLTLKYEWDPEVLQGGRVEPTPPKEVLHLHFGRSRRSLRAYTRADQSNDTDLLRVKGVSAKERDIVLDRAKPKTTDEPLIRQQVRKARAQHHKPLPWHSQSQCPHDVHNLTSPTNTWIARTLHRLSRPPGDAPFTRL